MNARVERYHLDEEEAASAASPASVAIRLHSLSLGPQTPVPIVPDDLLDHLKERFPNRVPIRPPNVSADEALIAVAMAWGRQEVIEYLESAKNNK